MATIARLTLVPLVVAALVTIRLASAVLDWLMS